MRAAIAAAVVAASAPALADPNVDRANDLFQRGRAAQTEGRFDDADRLYEQAWELRKSPDVAANLGQVELELGRDAAAANHFAYALDNLLPSTDPEKKDAIERNLARAKQSAGTLRIRTEPAGADVFVNGIPAGSVVTEHDVYVGPGESTVVGKLAGRKDVEREVNVQAGELVNVVLDLSELAPASVGVGSGLTDAAPLPTRSLPDPLPGAETPREHASYIPAAITLGASVVAIGAGIGFFVAAGDKISERQNLQRSLGGASACSGSAGAECAEIRDLNDQAGTLRAASFVLAGAGGVATFLLWPKHRHSSFAISPEAGRQAFRLRVLGRF